MTTLIVRDATLAVNGAPETRRNTADHLVERITEARKMDDASAEECLEVLHSACGDGDDVDIEVLLALTILGLARPDLAEKAGIGAVAVGRRTASRLEQRGDSDGALALIEHLRLASPGHRALERDYDAVLRRLGMITDLADRYYHRAQNLLRQGKEDEAVGWFKEVLLLDPSRRDVARTIRDLRLGELRSLMPKKRFGFGLLLAVLLPVTMAGVVLREKSLGERYALLPEAVPGNLDTMVQRLDALDRFLTQNPLWHGTFDALSERTDLRIAVAMLREEHNRRQFEAEATFWERAEQARLLYERARMYALIEDYETALSDFCMALEAAPRNWEHRDRVERDIAAISELLGIGEESGQ